MNITRLQLFLRNGYVNGYGAEATLRGVALRIVALLAFDSLLAQA